MGDWRADAEEVHDGRRIFLWIVPAVAGGRWALNDGGRRRRAARDRAALPGGFRDAGRAGARERPNLRGAALAFRAGERRYRGTIDGAAISGDGWRAERLG